MKKVLLLLAEGFESYEASAFIDVFGWNLVEGDHSAQLFSCGLKSVARSAFDQRFLVDCLVEDVNEASFDALAIPGGFEEYGYYNDAYHEKFLSLIRRFSAHHKMIASVCVGALPLAKSGALNDLPGTTYPNLRRREALKNFGVKLSDQPVVMSNNMITSHGPSTAIDVALLLLERLTTKENAGNIRRLMGY